MKQWIKINPPSSGGRGPAYVWIDDDLRLRQFSGIVQAEEHKRHVVAEWYVANDVSAQVWRDNIVSGPYYSLQEAKAAYTMLMEATEYA